MGLRRGIVASMRNDPNGGTLGSDLSPAKNINGPGAGGMMPGMPGARKIPRMPGIDVDDWEVPRSISKGLVHCGREVDGCLLYASTTDGVSIDLPKAPTYFGKVVRELILVGVLGFNVVEEVLKNVKEFDFRNAIYNVMTSILKATPAG